MHQKSKKKRILLLVLLLIFLAFFGIYTACHVQSGKYTGSSDIITRGEFCAELVKALMPDISQSEDNSSSFPDTSGHWAEKYIEALVDAGIIAPSDYTDGFKPDEPITRAEIIKMLVRARGKGEEAANTQGHSGYEDQSDIAEGDKGYVIVGKEEELIGREEDNKFHPNDPVAKEEAEDMIGREEPEPDTPATSPEEEEKILSPIPKPGGGFHLIPPAQVRFDLPETAHTDIGITVRPVWKYMQNFTWTLTKTTIDGYEQPINLSETFTGSLGVEGGIIQFKREGRYTLTATARNARGKETAVSKTVTVYPAIDLTFALPESTYTDRSVIISFLPEELCGHDIVWTASKDGKDIPAADILDGMLGNDGGTFMFKSKGSYTLTASITDEAGRAFSHTESTKVYPVADISFTLPAASHTDTSVDVAAALTEADGMSVVWSLKKNGETVALSDELEGTLTDGGGRIRFKDKGVYMLKGSLTDEAGRTFETWKTITIYPVGSVGFYLPEIAHTDETILVEAVFQNLESAKVQWSLTKNGEDANISDSIEGSLTDTDSTIRFKNKGEYVLKASFTDPAGRTYSYRSSVKVYPVPGITYQLPETAHTDTAVAIIPETAELGNLKVEWLLENGFGFQDFATYVEGSLDNHGGTIRFKHAGIYELIARVTDETGRVFLYENGGRIKVLPVLHISFELPETTHTDRTIDLRTRGNNNVLPAEWTLTKDGKAAEISDAVEGSLNAYGGKIQFKEVGEYTLTVSMKDALGRIFSYQTSTTVYPVPSILMDAPNIWYVQEPGTVNVRGTDLENLTADWTIVQNDGEEEPYAAYASGLLDEGGGSITFPAKGKYRLILTMTDPTGRTYVKNQSFEVFPIPSMSISIPPLAYSNDAMAVTALDSELSGTSIDWLVSVDGGTGKPFTEYASGSLNDQGGTLRFSTDKTIAVKLQALVTDKNGRTFPFDSNTGNVKPIASFPFTIPSTVHIGSGFNVSLPAAVGLDGRSLIWSLAKDGSPASYTGTLTNGGGHIAISATGSYILTASTTDSEGRTFSYSQGINVTNNAPGMPAGSTVVTRTAKAGKLLVNITASASDPDGDAVTLEYSGNTSDSYYTVGAHTVKVRARDAWGLYSDWKDITFTVQNTAPSTPVITRTPNGNCIAPGTAITITASSTDPDGDSVSYVWEGRPAQTSTAYPLGKNVVRVKAVDSTGAKSSWAAIVFFVADPNRGGGMTLTGPESVILEQGISGATITGYTFTVPPVSGHSGKDYGRVRGYNTITGQWDQLDYGTTTNGITFSRSLSPGVYSQLEFYYYTNHDCMYNKSNITYSVDFYFQ